MRILSIFNRYRQYGGEEAVTERIAGLLAERADCAQIFGSSTDEWLGEGAFGKLRAACRGIHNRQAAQQLEAIQREGRFDAWLVHNVFPSLSPLVFTTAQRLGVPVMFMMHNYRFGCINGTMVRDGLHCESCPRQGRWQGVKYRCWHDSYLLSSYNTLFQLAMKRTGFLERTAAFIALSPSQVPYLETIGIPRERITVIPHFVDRQEAAPPCNPAGDVLFMGRLSREKGADLLLKAWKELNPSGRRLLICGTGPEEETLKGYVRKHGLSGVEFRGFVPQRDHAELWAQCAFYAMPSTCPETAALSILEGWSYGRPALAFRIGAASDYLKPGETGWLAEAGSPESLKEALNCALNSPSEQLRQMSGRVRSEAALHYGRDAWWSRFSDLYRSITSTPERHVKPTSPPTH